MREHEESHCAVCLADLTPGQEDALAPYHIEDHPSPAPDPCPHDCAVGVGTMRRTLPMWLFPPGAAGGPLERTDTVTIWECTICRAIGEDGPDGNTITWTGAS